VRPLLAAWLVALVSGCSTAPLFSIHATEERDWREEILRLENMHAIAKTGTFIFVRGKLSSPQVYARSIVAGPEGVCFPSAYPTAMFWSALRVEQVDPRIAPSVIVRRFDIRVVRIGETAWEVHGNGESLQSWLMAHLDAVDDAHRNFINLLPITYTVGTAISWTPRDPDTLVELVELARAHKRYEKTKPRSLLGWRWSDFDRVDYFNNWTRLSRSDSAIDDEILENDIQVRRALIDRIGFVPGPCPLRGEGTPLLPLIAPKPSAGA
jgi:hypothetical protein